MAVNEPPGPLKSPYPYFGGKSRIAPAVWERLGNPRNYIEPFFGSGAMLLSRDWDGLGTETVNDLDGMIANFWRALKADPEAVANFADWPVNENDLTARHIWLVNRKPGLSLKLEGDPDYFEAKAAGWWVWGMACWIGGGFCSGSGPWGSVDGQRVHLGTAGQGVNRKLVHLGDAGRGLHDWMQALAKRMERLRVCCGDWARVTGPSVLWPGHCRPLGSPGTAVFLDPPYADTATRCANLYAEDSLSVAHDVREWAIKTAAEFPNIRIALAGYEGEHVMPGDWEVLAWKGSAGMQGAGGGSAEENSHRERIWFSPACAKPKPDQRGLWDPVDELDETEDDADDDEHYGLDEPEGDQDQEDQPCP